MRRDIAHGHFYRRQFRLILGSIQDCKIEGARKNMKPVLCKDGFMNVAVSTEVATILQSVVDEFGSKTGELFDPVVVRMDSREGSEFDATKKPGVYVFIDENGTCLKVGKHNLNASKRALEHCRDNTSSKDGAIHMADRVNCEETYMLEFALQDDSRHWVLALEYFPRT
jgi:hypothetical protein